MNNMLFIFPDDTEINSFNDLNLILSEVNIPPASPKTYFVDNPGGEGSIDLTETLGEVRFKDRTCSFVFHVLPEDDFEEKKTQVSNLLNGKRCKIRLDKDPGYYWDARCTIDEYHCNRMIRKIVVGAVVAPYKLKSDKTMKVAHFCGKNLFVDDHGRYTRTRDYFVCPVLLEVGKTYTASVKLIGTTMTNIVVAIAPYGDIYAELKEGMISVIKIGGSYYGKTTFTVDSTWTAPKLAIYTTDDTVAAIFDSYEIQLEVGPSVTEYEGFTPNADPQEITLTNARKSVVPNIVCTADATITHNGNEYNLNAGTHKILDLHLREGKTPVTVSATAGSALAFVYQEGDL